MPRQSKCSYCQKEGHNITQCDSERGNELYHHIRAKGFEFICLEWRTIHQRASMFYCYLMRICRLDEIKLILSKRQCRTSGRKRELAARIVNSYFIQELAYGPYSRYCIKHKERVHIDVYANYWRLLAEGELLNEAKQYLDRFLDLIKQLEPKHKFPINVVMKTVDLSEGAGEAGAVQSFECAICMEEECPILDQVELGCGHSFCVTCVSTMLTNSQNNKKHPCCGLCRADFKSTLVHTPKIMEHYNTRFCYSC
jgi:hypothetical protein